MQIYFQNLKFYPLLKCKIKKIYASALDYLGIDFNNFSVNLQFVSGEEIKALNLKFREKDAQTDVLSFPSLQFETAGVVDAKTLTAELGQEGFVHLGDIAICRTIAKEQAKEFGHSFKREVCFLALHGLLHLFGFDHLTKDKEAEMMAISEEILEKNKVGRNV